MTYWRTSSYSSSILCDSGELILYNSFMGAIACIPVHQSEIIKHILEQGISDESILYDDTVKELCYGGFFVPEDISERDMVFDVLERERNSTFSVIVLPHENCNFRCFYCYETFERGMMERPVINGLKALIDRKANEHKRVSACWFGGEPLLALDIIHELSESFKNSCDKVGIPYTSSMTTNGYLLTSDLIDPLLRDEIRHFQITLDGPDYVHNQTRKHISGRGTYRQIMDNLKAMRKSDGDFRVKIRVNYDSKHMTEIVAWIHGEIVSLFGGDQRFSMSFHPVGRWGSANDSRLEICDATAASHIRCELNETSLASGLSDKSAKDLLKPHGNVCYAAKESSVVVGADGTLYKCTVAFDDPRNCVGMLKETGDMIIDEKHWDLWVKPDEKTESRCLLCSFYPPCQGRKCPLAAMNVHQPCCPMTLSECEAMVKAVTYAARQPGL